MQMNNFNIEHWKINTKQILILKRQQRHQVLKKHQQYKVGKSKEHFSWHRAQTLV